MIIRRRHTKNFTTITNDLFDDERLAIDEVGMLGYLLSRPHDWEIRRPALQRRWNIGPVAVKRMVRNLMKTGWCRATKVRLPNGTFCILYDIFDLPGRELSDDEITEALSLVSGEVVRDGVAKDSHADEPPHISGGPPPCQPVVVDHPSGDEGVAYIEGPNTEEPRDESYQNSERELARAREKHALMLTELKRRWPTAASDDQGKIEEEWFKLELDESEPALAGIVPFLEKLKRDKRTTVPAAWKYLKEKRWTLLEQQGAANGSQGAYPRESREARAIQTLFTLAGALDFFVKVVRKNDVVYYRHPMTPQLLKLADAPPRDQWVKATRQQAGKYNDLLEKYPTIAHHKRILEGDVVPWPWAPNVDGTLSSATGPPPLPELSEQDLADFR